MKNKILTFLIFTACACFSFAADNSAGTGGSAFMKIPAGSAKLQGLGNNGVSYLEGSDAMSVNPAGIALSQMREFNFSYLNWFADYSGKYVSYVEPIGQSVIGFNLAWFGMDGFDARDSSGIPLNSSDIKVRHIYGSFALAKSFFLERFSLGAAVKMINEDNYSTQNKNTVYDMGALLRLSRKLSLGWASQNTGSKSKVVGVQRYGLTWKFNPFLLATVDQKKFTDSKAKTGLGIEFAIPEEVLQVGKVVLRTGYSDTVDYGKNYDDKTLDTLGLNNISGWSFGLGIYTAQAFGSVYSFDYSMVPFGSLGKSSQFTVKIQF
ncbi:MAG: hypothetical protein GX447_07130 [Elusimicrobia bacterium]|nr:hypothetical protein [Elusimicrobiota bacterium]